MNQTAPAAMSSLVPVDQRRTLLVERDAASTTRDLQAKRNRSLANPHECETGERERRPVDERVGGLVCEDGPEEEGDRDAGGKVALGGAERVRGRGGLEEEERKEDEDLGPDAGVVRELVAAESGEGGEDDEDGRPAMVEGERQMHKDLVGRVCRFVELLDDVVNVRHRGGDEKCKDKRCGVG